MTMIIMQDKTALSIAAIMGIVILDSVALCMGIDGTLLIACIGAIAGIGGYRFKAVRG